MYKRLLSLPKKSCFLFGARGTGKTTLLKQCVEEAHFVNLLNESKYQSYLQDIDLFRREIESLPKEKRIVVDEVQRLPELLNYVHDFIESQKRTFILTGSSARQLKRNGVNLLAGRALVKNLFPLVPSEMAGDFNIDSALRFGTLPIVVNSESPEETLKSYALTYLQQEIKGEALVKNLQGFSRFLNVAAIHHGQILNISNVARDAGVARTTVSGFFELLEDTLIGSFLPAYQSRPKAREVRHPKFYLFDPGVVRTIKRQSGVVDDDEKGFLLEGFVYHCLRACNSYLSFYDEVFYWTPLDAKSLEVDFVIRRGKELTAIEVKAKTRLKPDDLKGLVAINQLTNVARRYLVYLGKEKQTFSNGIVAVPLQDFEALLMSANL